MTDGRKIEMAEAVEMTVADDAEAAQATAFTSVPRHRRSSLSMVEVMAVGLSIGWLFMMAWFFLGADDGQMRLTRTDPLSFMMTILGVFLPVAMIWVAAAAARTARTMREESARLQAAIDAMRLSYVDQQQRAGLSLKRSMEERIDRVAKAQAALGAEVASLHATQSPAPVLETPKRPITTRSQQPALKLEDKAPPEALSAADFVLAMNFPENERDKEGFRVLRLALEHHPTSQLVTAAQDVLTMLSEDGIYMDDLSPHHADPTVWRAFADGKRGKDIGSLAGIRDRSSLALTGGRMKEDQAFRDAVHHFLQTFDRVFAEFATRSSDLEVAKFSNTRTARAFMLTGRVAGTFE
ncbi:MAG: hypothetical protein AAFY65_05855 [Pseudomonadota bacterium]